MNSVDIRNAKLALAFQALNTSGSGYLSSADFETYAKTTADRLHCDAERARELSEAMRAWWRQLEEHAKGPVTVIAFTNAVREGMDAGDAHYDQGIGKIVDALVHAADRNGDGIISEQDYLLFFEGTAADEATALEGYRKLDLNADGVLTVEEFRKAVRQFYSAEGVEAAGSFLLGNPLA
ncbi:EF-hand domain-containing protein [Nonomuraea sp. PA05]|uniref:EF-hand domain-containing protein n=1 Tax=Nonomuraea sp. PA05 TaxID=2604466 RepID=UPI001651B462|nr:EF-hand domain-containing protein [Nonomuraea sp. PA05]